jgi:hypothetical protein
MQSAILASCSIRYRLWCEYKTGSPWVIRFWVTYIWKSSPRSFHLVSLNILQTETWTQLVRATTFNNLAQTADKL